MRSTTRPALNRTQLHCILFDPTIMLILKKAIAGQGTGKGKPARGFRGQYRRSHRRRRPAPGPRCTAEGRANCSVGRRSRCADRSFGPIHHCQRGGNEGHSQRAADPLRAGEFSVPSCLFLSAYTRIAYYDRLECSAFCIAYIRLHENKALSTLLQLHLPHSSAVQSSPLLQNPKNQNSYVYRP